MDYNKTMDFISTTLPEQPHIITVGKRSTKVVFREDEFKGITLLRGQCWLPKTWHLPETNATFKPGQIVGLTAFLYKELNISAAIVVRSRLSKTNRRQVPVEQVELLGLPLQWFAASHFSA